MRHTKQRRTLAIAAVIGGAILMWLSPDAVGGAMLMAAGIGLETVGVWLEHHA